MLVICNHVRAQDLAGLCVGECDFGIGGYVIRLGVCCLDSSTSTDKEIPNFRGGMLNSIKVNFTEVLKVQISDTKA